MPLLSRPSPSGTGVVLFGLFAAFALGAPVASAAVPPTVGATWTSKVDARSVQLNAEIDPGGSPTGAYFEYVAKAAFEADQAGGGDGFAVAKKVNLNNVGSSSGFLDVAFPLIAGLSPDTAYVYRLTATNLAGSDVGAPGLFITQPLGGEATLPDARAWEMVSPVDKNGGQVDPPPAIAAGGVLQAAQQGGAITYGSSSSFANGQGSPPASQYLATRTVSGWSTENLTVPIFSGSYDTVSGGAPYRLFSPDLARGLLLNGKSCRGEATAGCPVPNPTLPGSDAPAGYQNYYIRDSAAGDFEALLSSSDIAGLGLDPVDFSLGFAGSSPDLRHIVLSTCASLTLAATDGCPAADNLYEWSAGGAPVLVNANPGAALAAQAGAISISGERVYFTQGGNLYLRDQGGTLKQVGADAGGGGAFEAASADGSIAFFTKDSHIWRYRSLSDSATDITPSGGVTGVLGAADDGSHLYYLNGSGLQLCAIADLAGDCDAIATHVADDADPTDYPPSTGTSRVSADGTTLVFLATAPLTGFDNIDANTKAPDSQLYRYDTAGPTLTCVSCNPTNERPVGLSTIPGAIANGAGPNATLSYKPRVLSADGRRLFFESEDDLALADTNSGAPDVYQWEAQGEGDCSRTGGCLALISSGRDAAGARFGDASADGADVYFLTGQSLVGTDLGGIDIYDARIDGGFPDAVGSIPCQGDSCQVLPPDPIDPTLTTRLTGPGNPPVKYQHYKHRFKKKHNRCKHRGTPRRRSCHKRHTDMHPGRGRRMG